MYLFTCLFGFSIVFYWKHYSWCAFSYILIYSTVALSANSDKHNKLSDGAPRSDPQAGRVLSLSDILYRSEANSDASQDGPRSERDDSDYDEELELDFETSVSDDEGHDTEPNVVHGSVNFKIHHRDGPARGTDRANGSSGSPTSSQNDRKTYQVLHLIFNFHYEICLFCVFEVRCTIFKFEVSRK